MKLLESLYEAAPKPMFETPALLLTGYVHGL